MSPVRAAVPDDVPVLHALVRELAAYEKALDEVVGFALWFLNFSTWRGVHGFYLEDLYVRPDRRGGGHGKALLAELARICVERGYERLEWSVLNWNAPSIAFYESLGARPQDEWTVYRLTDGALARLGTAGERLGA
ncbi:GNAT family N-acetyltransferase [Streptomyces sp. SID5594]|nr:GNAT family N-acetyltransferase [Streptomyces sp. SID5594]MZF53811.1 GNAT family N-acetyltransferase [Streptomyces sp. SID5594]